MENILEIEDLSVEYYTAVSVVPALHGVSLLLKKGECIGVVGESGCGKSTLVQAILDIINPGEGKITHGKIRLNGIDLRRLHGEQMRLVRGKQISLILQDPFNSLNPVIRIGAQLRESYLVHHPGWSDANKLNDIIKESLTEVHLPWKENFLNSYPHQLSGGMLQRICIAVALINSPEVLIADEPTSNLDVTIQKRIIENLKGLKEKLNLSLIFITHNLNLVSGFADRIYILYAGSFVEYGPTSRIFTNPLHPYTKGLINALPHFSNRGKKISPIPGKIPSPTDLPQGCSFSPRCEIKKNRCFENNIAMKEIEPGHFTRCEIV